jgi:hypothetical protein
MSVEVSDPDDVKLATLARASRARIGAREGAAVRDTDGRTYAAASVELPSLRLSALKAAVAMAVSSGAGGIEAAVVVTDAATVAEGDVDVVRDVAGSGARVYRADRAGGVVDVLTT